MGYQSFKYENSLIGSIFPTSPGGSDYGDADILPSDETEARDKMVGTVAGRGKYFYSYVEYNWSILLKNLCNCCCKRKDWFKRRMRRLERHEKATDNLAQELDVVDLIYIKRLSQFLAKLVLKKHQRALITSFRRYQLDDLSYLDEDNPSQLYTSAQDAN